ncbi:T9SS C-terminal target domain-containing protein [candidate division KSB1 bacterium]|nr:FG-GAP repeat protein [candidate division KSB1 bacterium]RQV99815.1 MAG: T9SS C-terminal target domain-containing protein [candidate division KSB1 bacterium]
MLLTHYRTKVYLLVLIFIQQVYMLNVSPAYSQIKGKPQLSDQFGWALASGDFNDDGHNDLAIGVPYENIGVRDAGAVNVLYGSNHGLSTNNNKMIHLNSNFYIPGETPERDDNFGAALAAGDFNGDFIDDLAIGIPGKSYGDAKGAGAVVILYGKAGIGLTAEKNQIFRQQGLKEANDWFGFSLATGDFDHDLADDLAIGVPGEDFDSDQGKKITDAGQVDILYGKKKTASDFGGLSYARYEIFREKNPKHSDMRSTARPFDYFGWCLAVGNFNWDFYDDLAIGVPYNDVWFEGEWKVNAGSVNVLYGQKDKGLTTDHNNVWTIANDNIEGWPRRDDGFGWALAVAEFGYDGCDDLAIGVPGKDIGFEYFEVTNAGAVYILFGEKEYTFRDNVKMLHQENIENLDDYCEDDDYFGWSLATGNFDGSGFGHYIDDLAIGVPFEDVGDEGSEIQDAGAVVVVYGMTPLCGKTCEVWHQDQMNIKGQAEPYDLFGAALIAGDFKSPVYDLAIGVPREDVSYNGSDITNAGAVNVIYGDSYYGLHRHASERDQIWYQSQTDEEASLPKPISETGDITNTPNEFALQQNYPNPFNPSTHISYQLAEPSHVSIKVYNLLGKEVITLVKENQPAGAYTLPWNGTDALGMDVPSGTYIYCMRAEGAQTGQFDKTRKMVLLR